MIKYRGYAGLPHPPLIERSVESTSTTDAREESADDNSYRLTSIDAVRAPEGCVGSDWHIYRIAQGKNGITGYRRGELARVKSEVETIVAALNGRRQSTKRKELTTSERRAAAAAAAARQDASK